MYTLVCKSNILNKIVLGVTVSNTSLIKFYNFLMAALLI